MIFDDDTRDTSKTITKEEFEFIKTRQDFLVKSLQDILKHNFVTTEIYDFLNLYMPGFYERFYFHVFYVNTIDTRSEPYDEQLMRKSLINCKRYYNKLERPDLYEGQMTHKGIMFLTFHKDGYVFNDYDFDYAIVRFLQFVNEFETYRDFYRNSEIFLSRQNMINDSYPEDLSGVDQRWMLFGKDEIERY